MRIVVTGSNGMLAKTLIPVLSEGHDVIGLTRESLDITDKGLAERVIKEVSPNIIINCAAYTKVDKAEEERERAFLINGKGVQNLALICADMNIPLCHISTDYVFDGRKNRPYTPFDNTNPVNTYGESKLSGERYIEWITGKFYVIRTSWLYGEGGNNFVYTILRLAKEKKELRVVNDQIGSPTSTLSLSNAIKRLITTGAYGIYHYTDDSEGGISWFDFAAEILKISSLKVNVSPIRTEEFPLPAKRPSYSVLDTEMFYLITGHRPLNWKDTLRNFLARH
ncbi:MAG: dTDP-4-dehydrorhamnose reductase [Thermodesulfovibrionales bacterium]